MGLKFNPLTAQFDLTGSGGGSSYIDGEVATYNDLPLDGTAALDSAWLVRSASGVWPVSRKQAGIYIRTATGGVSRDADFTYAGTMPDVFSDAVLTIYDDASTTRTGQFNLGSITAGQNRVLTWPDGNGTIARTEDFAAPPAIGSTTANAGSFTALNATGTTELVNGGTTAGPFRLYNTSSSGNANFERLRIAWASNVAIIGTEKAGTGSARALEFQTDGTTRLALSTGGLVQFAGTTSSFPALKRSSTTLQVRLADDSAFAPFEARDISLTTAGAAAAETGFTLTHGRGNANDSVRLLFQPRGTANAAAANAEILCTGISGPFAQLSFRCNNNERIRLPLETPNQTSAGVIFSENISFASSGTMSPDVVLFREAANILGQRNATNAQTFRLYSTYSSATSFERLNIIAQSAASVIIGTEKGSGGGSARGLELRTDNTARLTFGASGTITLNTTLAADAQNISTDTTTGTKIGTGTTQKIGFFNATPVVQQAAVADATDAASTQARLNDLLARLRTLGLIAT